MRICPAEKCAGCGVCVDACPQNCISMKKKQDGFNYPIINIEYCIKCDICKNVCPQINRTEKKEPISCFAAYDRVNDRKLDSSSGGVAQLLYGKFLENEKEPKIVGVALDEQYHANFEISNDKEKIKSFQGSKYIQANTAGIYTKIGNGLKNGEAVCFVGLPCHVAALLNYCRLKHVSTNDLLTINLLCHGVSSQQFLDEELEYLMRQRKWKTIDKLSFRSNRRFRNFHLYIEFTKESGKKGKYNRYAYEDPYFYSFLTGISMRNSCCTCEYATSKRVGDITIGDFIGLGKMPSSPEFQGDSRNTSVVLCHTEKGIKMIKELKEEIFLYERPFAEAVEGGSSLQEPYSCHPKKSAFFEKYNGTNFLPIIYKVAGINLFLNWFKYMPKRCAQSFLEWIGLSL